MGQSPQGLSLSSESLCHPLHTQRAPRRRCTAGGSETGKGRSPQAPQCFFPEGGLQKSMVLHSKAPISWERKETGLDRNSGRWLPGASPQSFLTCCPSLLSHLTSEPSCAVETRTPEHGCLSPPGNGAMDPTRPSPRRNATFSPSSAEHRELRRAERGQLPSQGGRLVRRWAWPAGQR